ncbi:MAG: hypothetical protein K2L70_03645 [Clostridia bacterium]|nr:hypothetical protein [Clostridia bacterium]
MRVKKDWLKCYTCGGKLIKDGDGVYVCECCSNSYSNIEKAETEIPSQIVEQINAADQERKLRHFDKALETYNSIIEQAPQNLLAYWGAFLSEYGIEYVLDGGVFVPRMHLITRIPATQSTYLREITKICDEEESACYRKMAAEIEQLRNRTYELSLTQENCDVFICHGDDLQESQTAEKLYDDLTKSGLKVFMPSKSIPFDTPSAEACVFAASLSAQTMFVIATTIDTLEKNDYIWGRFINQDGKKIQVIHNGLNESEFPFRLRKTFQRQAPMSLSDRSWLKNARDFVNKKKDKKEESQKDASQTIITQRVIMQDRKAEELSEAMAMVLSNITTGNVDVATRIIREQFARLHGEELVPIAILCTELGALSKSTAYERNIHMENVRNVGGEIKSKYPTITLTEREVYCDIKDANLLIYLAKCLGAIKDRARQCFVLDMIDYHSLYNTRTVTELVQMLLSNGRMDEVGEVMREVSRLDGNALLLSYLNGYTGDIVQKQVNLRAVADKLDIKPAVSDDLNSYLSGCEDEGIALAVVDIMNRYDIPLKALGLNGALINIKDVDSVRLILENFGKRPLLNIEIDRLITIATNGGNEVANEVLKHLRYKTGISDLGSYNMQTILDKCDLEKIKIAFFDFNIDKKLASELLMGVIKGNGADRLATVSVLIGKINNIDIKNYEHMLLGGDPLKKEFMKMLAPKTGKYSDANRQIEAFLSGKDSDEDKREIFAMFGDFPFSKRSLELYLEILPERFDETYIKYLYPYLDENPAQARKLFVRHYEALIEGYEEHLEKIFSYVRSYDEISISRFITEFKGTQIVKDLLVPSVVRFADKPKKIDVVYKHVQCNILQAYLLTLSDYTDKTDGVIKYLRKNGMDASDKVVVGNKKVKFKDYLQSGEVSKSAVDIINAYIKL